MKKLLPTIVVALHCVLGIMQGFAADYREIYNQYKGQSIKDVYNASVQSINDGDIEKVLALNAIIINSTSEKSKGDDLLYRASALVNSGYIYMNEYRDRLKACEYFLSAIEIKGEEAKKAISMAYRNLGIIYEWYNMHPEAQDALLTATSYAMDSEYWYALQYSLLDLLNQSFFLEPSKELKSTLDRYNSLKIPADTPLLSTTRLLAKAYELFHMGETASALNLIDSAIEKNDALYIDDYVRIFLMQIKGLILYKTKKYPEALKMLEQTADSASYHNQTFLLCDNYLNRSLLYKEIGQPDSAKHYHNRYWQIKDSILWSEHLNGVHNMKTKHDLSNINTEMQQVVAQHQTTILILLIVALGAIIFALLLWKMIKQNKRLKESNQQLYLRYNNSLSSASVLQNLDDTDEAESPESDNSSIKYASSPLSAEEEKALYERICAKLESNPEIYSSEYTLKQLSESLDISHRYVSQAINAVGHKNFSTLLAEYRIREAARRLSDIDTYGHLTIETVAEQVGYQSRSRFNTIFKSITGLTPGQYQRAARTAK